MHSFRVFFRKNEKFINFLEVFTCRKFEDKTLRFFAFGSLLVLLQNLVVYISNIYFIFEKIEKKNNKNVNIFEINRRTKQILLELRKINNKEL